MVYIDFHTHNTLQTDGDIIAVNSYGTDELHTIDFENFFTVGIHPWNAGAEQLDKYLARIMDYTNNPKMIGIGEVGLDKIREPSIDIQQKVFIEQLNIAYHTQKPVTIHCVKAWDELLATKAKYSDKLLWAIHGFNGSHQLAKQLVDKGFYLSVGSSILNEQTKLQSALAHIPLNRLFLETDTSTVGIRAIYEAVSTRLDISIKNIKQQIINNFTEFYQIEPL
ncbi:MAG: TatD family hydrolase [Bacteroidales bacterium]|nr:TatD family hydrolase [Bacteroidales bacterium]MDD4673877.1 TatD family hydrolase [Bacteroidales bacterium]MDY0348655.1 TatD family hydrolase [Tenuifilaceae bacterium]